MNKYMKTGMQKERMYEITSGHPDIFADRTQSRFNEERPRPVGTARTVSTVPPLEMITGESVMPMDSVWVPLVPALRPEPTMPESPHSTTDFLKKYIGYNMRVQFLIGANGSLVDRIGLLKEVGESFIVLQPADSDDLLMCDLYSIKFVTIYH